MKKLILIFLCILLLGVSSDAFARSGHYHYRDGRYYRDAGWWGVGGFITGLAVGASVVTLPPRHETVIVAGAPYYYADGYYYQPAPNGYVVVAPPPTIVQEQASVAGANTMSAAPIIYILGVLIAILILAGIALLLKRIFAK